MDKTLGFSRNFFAVSSTFAMGMQKALISIISGSLVRTTHLTGTFTDLVDKPKYIDPVSPEINLL